MDSHPKVMTVTYGTFSCTLDGFDDPFTTMQLVAEYFRKLSADDRYFGGEPLQPDASKLHRIAESANPNKIDAEVSENSVILRQADVIDVNAAPKQINTDAPETEDAITAFSSRRAAKDTAILKAADAIPGDAGKPSDALVAALEENTTDTTTADELAPALEEDIPSETVSAAVKVLKSGEAIDRWLETANEKMATPEHVSKANALERLKAAVAATEAERTTRLENITSEVVQANEDRRDNTISFRRELAKVRKAYERETNVFSRPRSRSTAAGQSSSVSRPLVLDSGQRIHSSVFKKKSRLMLVSDQDASTPETANKQARRAAIRERQAEREQTRSAKQPKVTQTITPAKTTQKSNLPSFDIFAKTMGASTLIELLEASAAYMSLVLGKDSYTEQQISANLPTHIKDIVKDNERINALNRLNKRGFVDANTDGSYAISLSRKAAYQKKYLAS